MKAAHNGSGMNIAITIGPTIERSASGCGSENFISTIGSPVFWMPVSMAIVRTRVPGWRRMNDATALSVKPMYGSRQPASSSIGRISRKIYRFDHTPNENMNRMKMI